MPFCAKCGTSLSDGAGFCNACGAQTTTATPAASVAPQSAPLASNIVGALAYLGGLITGFIFLAVAPYNKDPFVRFHAFQSIFLSLAYIVFAIVWGAVFGMFFCRGPGHSLEHDCSCCIPGETVFPAAVAFYDVQGLPEPALLAADYRAAAACRF